MDWSPQQDQALRACAQWLRDPSAPQVFYLAGYAGTGKTTLAKHLVSSESPGRWLFAAFTGKASHVLRQKGCEGASTIHSLIYRPAGESRQMEINRLDHKIMEIRSKSEELTPEHQKEIERLRKLKQDLIDNNQPRFSLWINSPLTDRDIDGIVIDEVSMVDERIGRDLESFEKKILVLGDPAQLPPVGAGGYFTKRNPDITLTEVHRHAKESGILRLATMIRENESIHNFDSTNDAVILFREETPRENLAALALQADQVLVGLNKTRFAMNQRHRQLIGMTSIEPCPGDRLVCLRNDHGRGLFNGSQWRVREAFSDLDSKTADLRLVSEDDALLEVEVPAWLHHMIGEQEELSQMSFERRELAEFDWSYALTVHKAQGSQWPKVMVFDQSASFRADRRRWLYTAVTRAANNLTVII